MATMFMVVMHVMATNKQLPVMYAVVPLFYNPLFNMFKDHLDYTCYKTIYFCPKVQCSVLLNFCFKTTWYIRPYLHGPVGGLKIEGPLYLPILVYFIQQWLQPALGTLTVGV